jgi:hypothetical protein
LTIVGGVSGLDGVGGGSAELAGGAVVAAFGGDVLWSLVVGERGSPSGLLPFSLCGRIDLRAKALRELRFVPMTAAPSGVVLLLVGVVVEFLVPDRRVWS